MQQGAFGAASGETAAVPTEELGRKGGIFILYFIFTPEVQDLGLQESWQPACVQ